MIIKTYCYNLSDVYKLDHAIIWLFDYYLGLNKICM